MKFGCFVKIFMASKLSYYYEMCGQAHSWRVIPKLWNYTKYRFLKRQAVTSVRRYAPQIASLLLTMRCNLNCGYCNAAKILKEGREKGQENDANLEKVKRIFATPLFARCLLVDLLGGEPLLVMDLDKIVAYLAGRGHITNTSTNGLLLAQRIADLKRAGISRINVSLYGANRSVLERDLPAINKTFPVHMSMVLLRSEVENHPEKLVETARFVHDAGCRILRFWIYRPMGVDPRPEEIINDSSPAYIEFCRKVDKALPSFCLWPSAAQTGKVKKLCPQLWQRVGCDMAGNMAICCGTDTMLPKPNNNLFDGEPDVIFNHPLLVKMREQLMDPVCPPPEVCRGCNLLGETGW